MLKVLGQPKSINVRKVLWTLAEIDAPYTREDWGGETASTRDEAFLELNPVGQVPVLIDGNFVLTESNTICRYLAASHKRSDLLPTNPKGKARVEAWMDWQATDLNNAWKAAFMGLVRHDPLFQDAKAQQASAVQWNAQMALLDQALEKTGKYVCGETFTLADIVLAVSTNRWLMTPIKRIELPAVAAWMERLVQRQGFSLHCCNGIP